MPSWRSLLLFIGLATIYFVAGDLGLRLAFAHPSATPVWPPTGLTLAVFLLIGPRAWPGIFTGAFLVNIATQGTILTSLGIATGNTLEGLLGAHLVTRWANGRHAFEEVRSAFLFAVFAAGVATTVSATLGVASLMAGGFATLAEFGHMWLTWWLGNAAGALVVAPAILLCCTPQKLKLDGSRAFEATCLALAVIAAGLLAFTGLTVVPEARSPLEYITMPVLLWAAFRFGPREAALAVLGLSCIAIAGTLNGHGPFAWANPNGALLLLQGFMGVASATSLVLAAAMSERREAEHQLLEWSIKDPLTGLANYRELVAVLEREVSRSQRTLRSFAVLLLDLDELKRINDREGHLVGSRALVRIGNILRRSSRTVDTVARYGGDEFVVVLPETDEEETQRLADRVAEGIRQEKELPPISASVGIAVYPHDGDTVEALVGAADRRLYEAKGRRTGRHRVPSPR